MATDVMPAADDDVVRCSFCGTPKGNGCSECDLDTWVTSKKDADDLGPVWLDPCSNDRSHIQAARTFRLDRGQDGLVMARFVPPNPTGLVFVNPPFSAGSVIEWILAYRHTRFCFLVRMDFSTQWFAEMYPSVGAMVSPHDRTEFEPPRGLAHVEHPGPTMHHAFYFRDAVDIPDRLRARSYVMLPQHKELRR